MQNVRSRNSTPWVFSPSNLRALARNRWVGLAAASWVEACAGLSYMFSLYSQSFKVRLGYNQTLVDMVGMAKDAGGSVGLISGILADMAPPWLVLSLGALQSLLGFGGLWLVLSGKVTGVPLWVVMVLIAVGTNSATFYNTGGMITCVKNFPHSRGPVVGLLKGFMGLSGALFSQLYLAFYAPDPVSFPLLAAWFPALVTLLAMPAIHSSPGSLYQPQERSQLLLVLYSSCALAAFLLGANMLDHFHRLSRWWNLSVAVISLLVLASPAQVGIRQVLDEGQPTNTSEVELEAQRLMPAAKDKTAVPVDNGGTASWSTDSSNLSGEELHGRKGFLLGKDVVKSAEGSAEVDGATVKRVSGDLAQATPAGYKCRLEVGEDHSLLQAAGTMSFWLLFASMVGASGSGLTAINNLAQYGHSLGHKQGDIAIAVSLLSIWNFTGRVGAAYLSEHFLLERAIPRPVFMCLTQLLMACGHALFACSLPASLLLGSTVVGLAYGSQWGLMPAVASEVFGLRSFGMIYNILTVTNPIGSYLLSVCIAGRLYDLEASRQASQLPLTALAPAPSPGVMPAEPVSCNGPRCFQLTFVVLALSSLAAAVLSGLLALLTAKYYAAEVSRKRKLERAGSFPDALGG